MEWKLFFSFIFIIFAVGLLIFYWFVPFQTSEFEVESSSSNFSLSDSVKKNMQFYDTMRYPNSRISYYIYDCPLKKKDDMQRAFEIVSDASLLEFYPVSADEEISVVCDSGSKIEGGLFIAGEGGPTNITRAGSFNVILHGKILLIRESTCYNPNIATHELLHALGFDHSANKNNIMYPVSKCDQEIGQDIIDLIDKLYAVPSYADLVFEEVSAVMNGKYLDINISVRNNGLEDSEKAKIKIYVDEKLVKDVELDSFGIGFGRKIMLSNIWVAQISVEKLRILIETGFDELNKNNNEVILEIKNKK